MKRGAKPLWDEVWWTTKGAPPGTLAVRKRTSYFHRGRGMRAVATLVIEILSEGGTPGLGVHYASLPIEGIPINATTANIPKDIIKMFLTLAEVRRGAG
jgi:hypothetical protein